ncbi:MAG TPA: hypothetical protein PL124_03880 [Candidatus Cloacimonadota bacterium]|nr:hypothetical protein [Candidatus Cloacimonadota bacterium]HPS38530.1 hypothetical protein [Candidatus Cloacimonadota bacterium]
MTTKLMPLIMRGEILRPQRLILLSDTATKIDVYAVSLRNVVTKYSFNDDGIVEFKMDLPIAIWFSFNRISGELPVIKAVFDGGTIMI